MTQHPRTIQYPRPPRLHPTGVTFEASPSAEPSSRFAVRANGAPPPSSKTKTFKFQQAITSKP